MLRMEMGGLGVIGGITERNQRDGHVVGGKIQFLLQRLVVETAHPASAEALFGRLQLDVVNDDGAVDGTDGFAFVVVPAGFLIVADDKRHGSAELVGGATADFVENGGIIDEQDALRLVVAAGGGQRRRHENGVDFFRLDRSVAVFAKGVACFGKLQKIHLFLLF